MTTVDDLKRLCESLGMKCEYDYLGDLSATIDHVLLNERSRTVVRCNGLRFNLFSHPIFLRGEVYLQESSADVVTLPCDSNFIAHIRLDWLERRFKQMFDTLDQIVMKEHIESIDSSKFELEQIISGT